MNELGSDGKIIHSLNVKDAVKIKKFLIFI